MFKSIFYLISILVVNYIQNSYYNNFIMFVFNFFLAIVLTLFQIDIIRKLKIKSKIINILIPLFIFIPYFTESFIKSSGYINDIIIMSNVYLFVIFSLRLPLLIANIIMFYVYMDYDKKYIIFSLLGIVNGILLWLELGNSIINILNIIMIIIFFIFSFRRVNESKN